jgi:hypothetical protein
MRHTIEHDPIRDHDRCTTCSQGLSAGMAKMADMAGWPKDSATMIAVLRGLAYESIEEGTWSSTSAS